MAQALDAAYLDFRAQSSEDLRTALNNAIWGVPAGSQLKFYLEHYNALAVRADNTGTGLTFQTYSDVVDLINLVKNGQADSFAILRANIAAARPSWLATGADSEVRAAIDLALQLWLMINIDGWIDDTKSLRDYLQDLFPAQPQGNGGSDELSFNARSLQAIGGLEILWTSRLSEHLRLNKKASVVQIYPPLLLQETAETMGLLFPLADNRHHCWNRRIRKLAEVDVETGLAANISRDLAHYTYWRARLAAIQEFYDNSHPKSLPQWVHDRRDMNKWSTFWLAVVAIILALLFGLVQSITGVWSLVKG